jgi:hypothetical protein
MRKKNKKRNVHYCQRKSEDMGIYSVTGCIGILEITVDADGLLFIFSNGIN